MKSQIDKPESPTRRRPGGFVFIAALGAMAVGLLIAFAMSGSVQFTYHRTGASLGDVQEMCMVDSAVEYALYLFAQDQMTTDGQLKPFTIQTDHLRNRTVEGDVAAFPLAADHPIYQLAALDHRAGDVLIYVGSQQLEERQGRRGRYVLCNTEGGRLAPTDVTQAIRYVPGGMVLDFSS